MYGSMGESNPSSGVATTVQAWSSVGNFPPPPLFIYYNLQENRGGERRFFFQMRPITVGGFCSAFSKKKGTHTMCLTIQECQSDRHWFKWDVSSSAWYSCSPSSRQYVIWLSNITQRWKPPAYSTPYFGGLHDCYTSQLTWLTPTDFSSYYHFQFALIVGPRCL